MINPDDFDDPLTSHPLAAEGHIFHLWNKHHTSSPQDIWKIITKFGALYFELNVKDNALNQDCG